MIHPEICRAMVQWLGFRVQGVESRVESKGFRAFENCLGYSKAG